MTTTSADVASSCHEKITSVGRDEESNENDAPTNLTSEKSNSHCHGLNSFAAHTCTGISASGTPMTSSLLAATATATNKGGKQRMVTKRSQSSGVWNKWKKSHKLVPRLAPRRHIQRKQRRPLLEEDLEATTQNNNTESPRFQFQRKPPTFTFGNPLPTLPFNKGDNNDTPKKKNNTNRLILRPRTNEQNGHFPDVPCMATRQTTLPGTSATHSATTAMAMTTTTTTTMTTASTAMRVATASSSAPVPDSPPRQLLQAPHATESKHGDSGMSNNDLAGGGCLTPRSNTQTHHLSLSFDDPAALTPPAPSTTLPLVVSAKRLGNEVRRNHSSKRRRGRSFVATSTSASGNSDTLKNIAIGNQDHNDDHDHAEMFNLKDPQFDEGNGKSHHDDQQENKENHNIFMSEWRNNGNKKCLGRQRRRRLQGGGGAGRSMSRGGYYDDDDSSSSDNDCIITPSNMELLSPCERTRQYWLWCYGKQQQQHQQLPPLPNQQEGIHKQSSWSASRKPPAKSCLSSTKRRNNTGGMSVSSAPPTLDFSRRSHQRSQSMPLLELHHTPQQLAVRSVTLESIDRYATPNTSFDESSSPLQHCSHGKSVQFGSTIAAEYDIDGPTDNMTPLAPEVANRRFPVLPKDGDEDGDEEDHEERESSEETKRNTEILAQWEDSFDDDDDDSEEDDDDDDDDSMDDDDDEEGIFFPRRQSRRRSRGGIRRKSSRDNRRRSSGLFSPSEGSIGLLDDQDEEGNSSVESDVEVESNMACLAVESPMDDKKFTPPALKSMVVSTSSSECTEDLSRSSSTSSDSSQVKERRTTPPTDVRLSLECVNTSGAAELDHASSPMDNTNKQLHGVLEQCVVVGGHQDKELTPTKQAFSRLHDILQATILKDGPKKSSLSYDQFVTALRRLSNPNCTHSSLLETPDNVIDFLPTKCGSKNKMPKAVLRKTILKMIQAMEIFSTTRELPNDTSQVEDALPKNTLLESALDHEWQAQEVKLLQALLKGLIEWGKRCDKEVTKVDEYLQRAIFRQKTVSPSSRTSRKQMIDEHEKLIQSLQEQIQREQHQLDLMQSLEKLSKTDLTIRTNFRTSILQSLTLGTMVPFSVHTLDDDHIELEFSHVAEGLRIFLAMDLSEREEQDETRIRGYVTFHNDDKSNKSGGVVIPREHVANRFYQSLLRCGGSQTLPSGGRNGFTCAGTTSFPLSPFILEAIQSSHTIGADDDCGSDLHEITMTMSKVVGSMDSAVLGFQNIADHGLSLMVMNNNDDSHHHHQQQCQQKLIVGTSIEMVPHTDNNDGIASMVVLVIPLSSTIHVRFSYDRQIHECIVYCTPTVVEVVDISKDGNIVPSLQSVADQKLIFATTSSTSVAGVDTGSVLQYTCEAIYNQMNNERKRKKDKKKE